jgi:maltose-binding protein MalE
LVSNFSIIEKFKQQKIIWINKTSTRNTSYNISSISGFLDKPRRLTRWTNQKEKTSSVVNAVHQPLKCLNVNVKNQKKKTKQKTNTNRETGTSMHHLI